MSYDLRLLVNYNRRVLYDNHPNTGGDLVAERKKIADEIERYVNVIISSINTISYFISMENYQSNAEINYIMDSNQSIIDDQISALKNRTLLSSEFSGMSKYLIEMYRTKYANNLVFKKLFESI